MPTVDGGSTANPIPVDLSHELRYCESAHLVDAARRGVASVDRNPSIFGGTLRTQTEQSLLCERLLATLSSFFGEVAPLLACLGLYGLMVYRVVRRTLEIGIRIALGARRPQAIRL